MATAATIQVNANTQQAVSAFNALAQAISNANLQVSNLNVTINQGSSTTNNYGRGLGMVSSAFDALSAAASAAISALKMVAAGIEAVFTAITRELDKLQGFNAMMSVSTKSSYEVSQSYSFLRDTANRLGVQFDALLKNYGQLLSAMPDTANKTQVVQRTFLGLAEAARTLHASNQDTQLMFYAITQMASKGVVSMEELRRQLGQKLPGTMEIAARAVGTTVADLQNAIKQGTVDATKFLNLFGSELVRTFKDSSEIASNSTSAAINRLTNVWVDFVKAVLDSGASSSIVNVLDALREKLSDPYVIQRFAETVKYLADKLTDFIKNLSEDDIRQGFDTFIKFVHAGAEALGDLIKGFTWIIDHGQQTGAILGGIAGTMVGLQTKNVWATLAATGAGAAGGYYLGGKLQGGGVSGDDLAKQEAATAARVAAQQEAAKVLQNEIQFQSIPNLLKEFKFDVNGNTAAELLSQERATEKTINDLVTILTTQYKNPDQQRQALNDYAKYGTVLAPRGSGIQDVLGGPGKETAAQKSLDATYERAIGLNANYPKELQNLITLQKEGRLTQEQYVHAVEDLIAKQPFAIELAKEDKKSQEELNKAIGQEIDFRVKQIQVKDQVAQKMSDELKLAHQNADVAAVEAKVTQNVNEYKKAGIPVDEKLLQLWRDQYFYMDKLNKARQLATTIKNSTTGKYDDMTNLVGLSGTMQKDQGLSKQQIGDYAVANDPNMQGGSQWMDIQKRQLNEYYQYVDMLRNNDVISNETAEAAKARAQAKYDELRMQSTVDMFSALASLSSNGNKRLAEIGKRAAIAEATIKGYQAIQEALAAPPGWPYNAVNVAAVTIQQAANVANIVNSGYQSGGYTGDGGLSEIAGVVHGKEFVMNAPATARNRETLEAMNRGATIGGSGNVSVIVNNNADGTKATVQERQGPNGREIEVLVQTVVQKQIASGGPIARSMERQYGLARAIGSTR